jgi:uncharacterized membrane protein YidH (DUF202 family)
MSDEQGSEPDYRFTLANERTFLAWVRTALAILAGAMVMQQLARHELQWLAGGSAIGRCLPAVAAIPACDAACSPAAAIEARAPTGDVRDPPRTRWPCCNDVVVMARDPGLQPERTRLAWVRTATVAAVNAAIMLRGGVVSGSLALFASGALCACLGVTMLVASSFRGKQLEVEHPIPPSRKLLRLVSCCVAAASACAALPLLHLGR